jgi:hypothetical protein
VLETLKKNGYYQLKMKSNILVDQSVRVIGVTIHFNIDNWWEWDPGVRIDILFNIQSFIKDSGTIDSWGWASDNNKKSMFRSSRYKNC